MISLDAARRMILSLVSPVDTERVGLGDAGGRVAAEDVRAPSGLPPTRIRAGTGFTCPARGSDGSHSPIARAAADPGDGQEVVAVTTPAAARVPRFPGDLATVEPGSLASPGDVVIPRGTPLTAFDIRLLAELGVRRVAVHRKPRVALVSIGDDLVRVEDALASDRRYDGSSPMVAAYVVSCGGIPVQLGPVPCRREDIEFAMTKAFDECDMLAVTTDSGAVEGSEVVGIVTRRGVDRKFLGVSLCPGHATMFGIAKGKPCVLTSSLPADLSVVLELLMRPLVLKLAGMVVIEPRRIGALLEQTLRCPVRGVTTAWAVRLWAEGKSVMASPVEGWPGGVVFKAASVHGLVVSPDGHDIPAGFSVEVLPLRSGFR